MINNTRILKNGKPAGVDGIIEETLKYGCDLPRKQLCNLFTSVKGELLGNVHIYAGVYSDDVMFLAETLGI